jgi:Tc5 transposase DNA-binding domain
LKTKLDAIRSYEKGVKGRGLPSVAAANGISVDTLRGWINKRGELEAALANNEVETRKARRLAGGGRPAKYEDLEERLHVWIKEKNSKGLNVRDQYIQQKSLNIYSELFPHLPANVDFKASNGWLANFKGRKNLVSRRQTTCRHLPPNADDICRRFIQEVHNIIELKGIKNKNIINMDQVSRYFETEPKSTITTRGSRDVLLRKGGTSHKAIYRHISYQWYRRCTTTTYFVLRPKE